MQTQTNNSKNTNGKAKVAAEKPKAKRNRRDFPRIDAETFVREWQIAVKKGQTVDELSAKLGVPTDALSHRATTMRKKGVPLGKFPRRGGGGGQRLDVDALTKLAENLAV